VNWRFLVLWLRHLNLLDHAVFTLVFLALLMFLWLCAVPVR
jgi:hypothetical protein